MTRPLPPSFAAHAALLAVLPGELARSQLVALLAEATPAPGQREALVEEARARAAKLVAGNPESTLDEDEELILKGLVAVPIPAREALLLRLVQGVSGEDASAHVGVSRQALEEALASVALAELGVAARFEGDPWLWHNAGAAPAAAAELERRAARWRVEGPASATHDEEATSVFELPLPARATGAAEETRVLVRPVAPLPVSSPGAAEETSVLVRPPSPAPPKPASVVEETGVVVRPLPPAPSSQAFASEETSVVVRQPTPAPPRPAFASEETSVVVRPPTLPTAPPVPAAQDTKVVPWPPAAAAPPREKPPPPVPSPPPPSWAGPATPIRVKSLAPSPAPAAADFDENTRELLLPLKARAPGEFPRWLNNLLYLGVALLLGTLLVAGRCAARDAEALDAPGRMGRYR